MRILEILNKEKWVNNYDFFNQFKNSSYYDVLIDTYKNLNTDILFESKIHGQGHIERVIFHGLVLSWKYNLDKEDTDIIRYAASLHDTQRVSDGYDTEHGHRAALESVKYADISESDREILKGVLASHSRSDKKMEESIKEFKIEDLDRAFYLTNIFKDADGLDRVRISDLNTEYLRNEFSLQLTDFAQKLFEAYSK